MKTYETEEGVLTRDKNGRFMQKDVLVRFWCKVNKGNGMAGCWEWLGSKTKLGYGSFWTGSKTMSAHHFAYLLVKGPVPEGLELDHLCRNPSCVNPKHLEPVSRQIHNLRGLSPSAKAARKTHCPQGHPYDLFNTRYTHEGFRICRQCERRKLDIYIQFKKTACHQAVLLALGGSDAAN